MSVSESEQGARTKNLMKRTLDTDDEDSKQKITKSENSVFESTEEKETLKEEEDDDYDDVLLPLTFSFCKEPFSDPIFTNCNHCFCKNCDIKHHEKNEKYFACEEPTLGVNTAVEIKKKIAKEREQAKAKVDEAADIVEKVMTMTTESDELPEEVLTLMSKARDMATTAVETATKAVEMMEKANAVMETARNELAKSKLNV